MFLDNTSEMINILWGSVYIFEFLRKYQIISEKNFEDFIYVSRSLKGKVIGQFTTDLWNSNFVHQWEKPDCISKTEFIEESNIFKKSISFKYQKFTRLRSKISEELSKIGELSDFIVEGGKRQQEDTSLIDNLFAQPNTNLKDNDNNIVYEPITTEKKVGRNDPCPCGSGKKYKKCCGLN